LTVRRPWTDRAAAPTRREHERERALSAVGGPHGDATGWSAVRRSPPALFAVAALGFGSSFVAIKSGLASLPPLYFAGLRFDVGAVVLLSALLLTRGKRCCPVGRTDFAAVAVGGVLLLGLNGALLFLGQRTVTSGAAAVTYSLAPVTAPLVAVAVLDEPLDPLAVVGTLVALVGVGLVAGVDPAALAAVERGQLLVAGAALSVALGSVLLRVLDHGLTNLELTAWSMAVAAAGLHAGSLFVGESVPASPATATVLAVLWVGLPATAVAFPAYFGLIARIGPSRANLVAFVVPVVATITGVVVLGETVRPGVVAGFLLIAAAFTVVERRTLRREYRRLRARPAGDTRPSASATQASADSGSDSPADGEETEHVCEPMPRGD
jgi:drug/metabolite transporter (DMT)-like permease